jgi:hypothetical protein
MIIQVNGIDIKTYGENPQLIIQALCRCPLCEDALVRNGSYGRWAIFFRQVFRLRIFRVYCGRCDVAFTLLPHFLLPRHRHLKMVLSSWLWACLTTSLSSRSFLKPLVPEHGQHSSGAKGQSYSDHFDSCVVRPGRSLLQYWLKAFSQRAARSQAVLVVSCAVAGRALKELSEIAVSFPIGMRRKAAPLAQALCLCSLLLSSHSLDLVFERLLVFLLGP